MTDNLEKAEQVLLPPGNHFSTEQRQVIEASENINIIAGPGSGKTTVLTAKLITLLSKQRRGDKGICCITHTNVAVDEIKDRIKQSEVGDIEYPNFIGTIQSFFDHYFGRKAFGVLFPHKKLRIFDGDQYSEIYSKIFLAQNSWWTFKAPDYKRRNARLIISNDNKVFFNNDEKKNYGMSINKALKSIIGLGIINSEQMTALAQWYISLHSDQLVAAMGARFDYVLLDEAQDTNNKQYQLLITLTKDVNIHFQRFGDPYQALYTIYGNESKDAWSPIVEEQKKIAQVKEISTTARFGQGITQLVKDVCYEEYPTFHSKNPQTMFNNYFISFDSGTDLREKYQRLLNQCETENDKFLKCLKTDKMVAPLHNDLRKWFPNYDESSNASIKIKQPSKYLFTVVLSKLAFANQRTLTEEHVALQENLDRAVLLSEIIKHLFARDTKKEAMASIVHPLLLDNARMTDIEISNDLIKEASLFLKESMKSSDRIHQQINLSTIHGVKGETHRSTILLLDSKVHWGKEDSKENPFFEALFPFLIGNRRTYDNESDAKFIRDCLKYAYVAISQPKFLAGVAIPASDLTMCKKEKMISYGWKEAK